MIESDFSNPVHWRYLFNSPLECGIRSVTNLASAYPAEYDLQRLLQLDYLVVHSGDGQVISGSNASMMQSIHPPTPYRFSELVVRRSFVDRGIRLMASRDLVTPVYDQAGIRYRASETAIPFLDSLGSQYIGQLRNASESVANKFSSFFRRRTDFMGQCKHGKLGN